MDALAITLTHDLKLLRGLRYSLANWLELAGASPETQAAVVLATHEAAANGMAHGDPDGTITVTAEQDGTDSFYVAITNDGNWQEQAPGASGRGLPMMNDLMSDVAITASTTVRMRKN